MTRLAHGTKVVEVAGARWIGFLFRDDMVDLGCVVCAGFASDLAYSVGAVEDYASAFLPVGWVTFAYHTTRLPNRAPKKV